MCGNPILSSGGSLFKWGTLLGRSQLNPKIKPLNNPQDTESQIRGYLKAHPDGKRISKHRVAFKGGSVIMNFTPDGATDVTAVTQESTGGAQSVLTTYGYEEGCPSGLTQKWFCFYEHTYYKGRMLQFRDCAPIWGHKETFADYGFQRKTSSWVNTKTDTGVDVFVNPDWTGRLWVMGHGLTKSSNVGVANNDRAYTFTAFC